LAKRLNWRRIIYSRIKRIFSLHVLKLSGNQSLPSGYNDDNDGHTHTHNQAEGQRIQKCYDYFDKAKNNLLSLVVYLFFA